MDPHQSFLKAICAARHDDLPRLVYADFLEETGDPAHVARAHFIRTQIAVETADPKSPQYAELKALEGRLLDMYLEDWRFELPEAVRYGSELDRVKWRRGFVDDLGPMTVNDFYAYGASAPTEMPLTSLHLSGRGQTIHSGDHPDLSVYAKLVLTSFTPLVSLVEDEYLLLTHQYNGLLSAPTLTSLRHLDLTENQLNDAWLIGFATELPNTSFAPTLETLDLSRNFGITDAGANTLATAAGFDRLTRLVVKDTGIGRSGMSMLKKRFGSRLANGAT